MRSIGQQRRRLLCEKNLLHRYVRGVQFVERPEDVCIDAWYPPRHSPTRFHGRIVLTPDYPHCAPELYVVEPRPLRMYRSTETLGSNGSSGEFYILGSSEEGCRICFANNWDSSWSCVKVFMKFALWVEAYDEYLKTGKTVAELVTELQRGDAGAQMLKRFARQHDERRVSFDSGKPAVLYP